MINFIDPIHGKIEYPDIIFKFVNTEEFQRLRNVKQLGVCSYVFAGAVHTRFEHSLGVCYLVNQLLNYLEKNSNISISIFHRNCLMIAGLLHDIGHGPFSHTWDLFVHAQGHKNWNHEQISCDIIRKIFKNYPIRLSDNEKDHMIGIDLICALIMGNYEILHKHLTADNMYLSEIVNNQYCSIDVDKWDYILRDAYYLNNVISIPKGFENAFKGARMIADENGQTHISYHCRDHKSIYEIFQNRANLHMKCYQNEKVLGIEQLLADILIMAEDAGFRFKGYKLSEAHMDLNVYKYLDDSIINHIDANDDSNFKNAQNLIRRLKTGEFYTIIRTIHNEMEMNELINKDKNKWFKKLPQIDTTAPKKIILYDDSGHQYNRENSERVKECIESWILYSRTVI